ncbi:MAG: hypothetical protein K0B11_22295 [Mariniphaga sp.]|nr:hypothetical protein [Mariniphaga sp.]
MKTIRKNFLLLAFAAGALFLIGNNVFGSDPGEGEDPGGDITCSQQPGPGAQCWRYNREYSPPCEWTGYAYNFCIAN